MQVAVPRAVAADARGEVHAPAGLAGQADGVLHRAVGQPARVAPVQPLAPRLEELVKVGEDGTLVLAHLLGFVEIEPVLPAGRLVGEHDAWRQMGHSDGSAGSPPNPSPAPAGATGVPEPCQIQALGPGPPPCGGDKAQACRDGAALDMQAPAASCQRHLVAQGHTGSVLGTQGAPQGDSTCIHRDAQTIMGMQGAPPRGCADHGPGNTQTVVPGRHGPPLWGLRDRCHGDAQASGTGIQGSASP